MYCNGGHWNGSNFWVPWVLKLPSMNMKVEEEKTKYIRDIQSLNQMNAEIQFSNMLKSRILNNRKVRICDFLDNLH